MPISAFLALILIPTVALSEDTFHYARNYKSGDLFGYQLKTVTHHNGQFVSEELGESAHKVTNEAIPAEEIAWTKLLKTDANGVSDLSIDARNVKPYRISLHPEGSLAIPPLDVPNMVGMITDLNTYYVAISKHIGIQGLSKPGDVYFNPNALRGNWSDGMNVPVGEDCTKAKLSLLKLGRDAATIESAFLAPESGCLTMHRPWMIAPIKSGVPNNFQLVRKSGDSFMVMWGHEQFVITTEVDRTSGVILHAEMNNTLTLRMKAG
jgi:hypothetical protein